MQAETIKVRIPADLHRAAKIAAAKRGVGIIDVVSDAMRKHPPIKAEMNGKEKR